MTADEARTFTLRALTTNAERRGNRYAVAKHIAATRQRWGWLAKAERIPHLERVRVTVTPLYSSGRSLSDPGGCHPELKAALDGLVDVGVIDGDTGRHVASITYLPPLVTNVDGLRIMLEEVPCSAG
jgi:hypothetical protein